MSTEELMVYCRECGETFKKDYLQRSCSNCFVCTSCEIYICPECRSEIVVKEVQKTLKG
jgi:uncharacterized protein YbaR (Trm112 family)